MKYWVHVAGRAAHMTFECRSTAEKYRWVMLEAGKLAWITS